MKLTDTPITQHNFNGIKFYLKRDDQLHQHFTGNKARKFMALLDKPSHDITTLISHGSIQSNTLYSLAALCAIKDWSFEFYVDHIPQWLIKQPMGNYRAAVDLGAIIYAVGDGSVHPTDYIKHIRQPDRHCLVVPEGGSFELAEFGIKRLAREILSWTLDHGDHTYALALPSGTGTTAFYLHKYLAPHGIEVITCPCVGGRAYLEKQMNELGSSQYPTIIELPTKHHFGKLYQQDYAIWYELKTQTDVEFDLLYDPMMWQCLQYWTQSNPHKTLIYLHQGGLLGNESMLPRYKRKYGALSVFENSF